MLTLRPYQLDALAAIRLSPSLRQLVGIPTGGGKTVIFSHLTEERLALGRVLILVHRDELVRQTYAKCIETGLKNVGIIQASRNDISYQVVVASVQSLARSVRQMQYLAFGQAETLIIDEAHHSVAPTYMSIIENCLSPTGLLAGFTATPDRKDAGAGRWHTGAKSLGRVFDHLAYYRPIDDMIAEGWLADVTPATVTTSLKLSKKSGDWSDAELAKAFTQQTEQDIVVAWENAMINHGKRPTIVFVPTVNTAVELADQFATYGHSVEYVTGKTPSEQRQEIYRKLRAGEIEVLVNCMVLTEGFDEPCISCVVVARPTKSRALFTQMVGRGLRLFPGKTDCLVMSVVDHDLNLSPVRLQQILDDEGWKDNQKLSERKKEQAEKEAKDEEEKASALAFVQKFKARSKAKLAWQSHMGMWRIQVPNYGLITLTEDGLTTDEVRMWQIIWPDGTLSEPQRIEGTVATAEQRIRGILGKEGSALLDTEAAWNEKKPSTAQLDFAKKLGIDANGMSRGELSQAISAKQTEPPTDKQVSYARFLGWEGNPLTTTKRQMAKWISEHAPTRKGR